MYGSYGSFSSMSAMSAPMDISARSLRAHDASCAFPSWPRRATLSSEDDAPATSFLSDDDLFFSDPVADDASSISSASSSAGVASPYQASSPAHPTTASSAEALLEMERERMALQRDYVRQLISEKDRRRQAMKKRRSNPAGTPKKSPKSKLSSMTPIAEAIE